MAQRPTRSLKHEYELFVEQEIENYKESVPRSVLLSIGDEAVAELSADTQFALTELLLCEEVDRIIVKRLRLPGLRLVAQTPVEADRASCDVPSIGDCVRTTCSFARCRRRRRAACSWRAPRTRCRRCTSPRTDVTSRRSPPKSARTSA